MLRDNFRHFSTAQPAERMSIDVVQRNEKVMDPLDIIKIPMWLP